MTDFTGTDDRTPRACPGPGTLRIGNASGFYGDRFDALREMLTGGPLDVLTGDYLAELTMLILGRDRLKDSGQRLREDLPAAAGGGPRPRPRAGGADRRERGRPQPGRTRRRRTGVGGAGRSPGTRRPRRGRRPAGARRLGRGRRHGQRLPRRRRASRACLRAGADVVVTGRVTDAALVTARPPRTSAGRADDLDPLAGAVVAGHVLECGTQATGGNYSFFAEHDAPAAPPRLPARRDPRGRHRRSSPSTRAPAAPSTSARSPPNSCTRRGGARYAGPDVTARLDTVRLTQDGPDRVRISGVRGEAPPPTLKVGLNRLGGWRNEVVFVLTGLDIEAKAALVRATDRRRRWRQPPGRRPLGRWPAPTTRTRTPRRRRARCCGSSCATPTRTGRPGPQRSRGRAGARQLPRLPCDGAARQGRAVRRLRGRVRRRRPTCPHGRAARRQTPDPCAATRRHGHLSRFRSPRSRPL